MQDNYYNHMISSLLPSLKQMITINETGTMDQGRSKQPHQPPAYFPFVLPNEEKDECHDPVDHGRKNQLFHIRPPDPVGGVSFLFRFRGLLKSSELF